MNLQFLNCILWLAGFIYVQSSGVPNAFLHSYTDVHYDRDMLHLAHRRVQRSTDKTLTLELKTETHTFALELRPTDNHHLANTHIEVHSETKRLVETPDNIHYEGRLVSEPNTSFVKGSIINGLFTGTIRSLNGIYQVEAAARYNDSSTSHSIIYHESDIKTEGVGCGSHSSEVCNKTVGLTDLFLNKRNES